MKKMRSAAIAFALVLAGCTAVFAAAGYSDVPEDHWAAPYIERASSEGAVQGIGEGKYDPDSAVTYAQFVTVLARKYFPAELSAAHKYPEFLNLGGSDYGDWRYPAWSVYAGEELLGAKKVSVNSFFSDPIPREDMALMIRNIVKKLNHEAEVTDADRAKVPDLHLADSGMFIDMFQMPAEFNFAALDADIQNAVAWCYKAGILQGVDAAGRFDPQGYVTRAQLAAIYCRTADAVYYLMNDSEDVPAEELPAQEISDADVKLIVDKENADRKEMGRWILTVDEDLCEAARIRAEEISRSFSHNRPDDDSLYNTAIPGSVPYTWSAENIAEAPDAATALQLWLDSESHYMNMTNGRAKKTGVGVYGNFFVQLFTN